MSDITSIIAGAVKIGMNLSDQHKKYVEWRMSEEGKQYYSREEENRFYDALAAGDTDIVDTAIIEKQRKIDELKKELGI